MYLDQHLLFTDSVQVLTESGGRALRGIINKLKKLKDVGFDTFDKMFQTAVIPVCNYGAEIWGFKD